MNPSLRVDGDILRGYGSRVSDRTPLGEGASRHDRVAPAWLDVARRHPVITSVLLGCTLLGALLGPLLLTADWSLLRRVVAGAVAGAGTGLLVTATKMYD
jgi:hypothetical protein